MIIRIVQMHFGSDRWEGIRERLLAQVPRVRAFSGCLYLALHQDADTPCTVYSISYWESRQALEAYRQSALFREFWAELKAHFVRPPQAFTLLEPLQNP